MSRKSYYKDYYKKLYKTNKDGVIEGNKSNSGVYKDFELFNITHTRVLVHFD